MTLYKNTTNFVPIHCTCIYNFAYTFRRHFTYRDMFFRSQLVFSCLNLIVCLDNHCIHNASCENRAPCVFPGQMTPVNLSWGGVNGSLDIQCLHNWGACEIKRWLSNKAKARGNEYGRYYNTILNNSLITSQCIK